MPSHGNRDRYLVLAHAGGDHSAFTEIVRQHYPALLHHAYQRLRDERAAEDAVQEGLLRAYRHLNSLGGEYRLGAWLHRIVANVCNDESGRRSREAVASERWSAEHAAFAPAADELVADHVVRAQVAAAIQSLPSTYREALHLRDVLELDYADVASEAGITEQNARARVSRARSALRRVLDASSSRVGMAFFAARRAFRPPVSGSHHVSALAGTVTPEMAMAPTRFSAAASSVAAALTVAAAVPVLTMAGSGPASPPDPAAQPHLTAVAAQPSGGVSTLSTHRTGTSSDSSVVRFTASSTPMLSMKAGSGSPADGTTIGTKSVHPTTSTSLSPTSTVSPRRTPSTTSTTSTSTTSTTLAPSPLWSVPQVPASFKDSTGPPTPGDQQSGTPPQVEAPRFGELVATLTGASASSDGTTAGFTLAGNGEFQSSTGSYPTQVIGTVSGAACGAPLQLQLTLTDPNGHVSRLQLLGTSWTDTNGATWLSGVHTAPGDLPFPGYHPGAFFGELGANPTTSGTGLTVDLFTHRWPFPSQCTSEDTPATAPGPPSP